MLKKVAIYHLLPVLIAAFICSIFIQFYPYFNDKEQFVPPKKQTLVGSQQMQRGYMSYINNLPQSEVDYFSSIQNPDQITIFGSSEFSVDPFCSFHFLPDSLGIPALGIGQGHHQSFSIFCELLAANKWLDNSKITLILSPGWFETEGTNPESFVKFVSPNLLNYIWFDPSIKEKHKSEIGRYIHENKSSFEGSFYIHDLFEHLYVENTSDLVFLAPLVKLKYALIKRFPKAYHLEQKTREFNTISTLKQKQWKGNYTALSKKQTKEFLGAITNNKLLVNDHYYETYLFKKGKEKKGKVDHYNLSDSREYKDLKLVIQYLKEKNANTTVIIQPLNPYYYSAMENNVEMIDSLTTLLQQQQIPYLNMYAKTKQEYEPGILKDVMHLGVPGWLKINAFLDDHYSN